MPTTLAIDGGTPVRSGPLSSGKKVGTEELEQLREVIESGQMNRVGGTKVKQYESEFAQRLDRKYAVASTSGTAALHVAVGMVNPSPGDEIIVAPITDIGSIIPILYQTAIPIFAEVDPETFNLDPASVEERITSKTRAIMAVHLFGNPCDLDPLREIARRHKLVLIEDCAQAHFSEYKGRLVGSVGDIGCFSLQQSKHMTAGDGGITLTDQEEFGLRGTFFADKGWARGDTGPRRYVVFGLNYRMTELQGAVALAQLHRASDIVGRRRANGDLLVKLIADVPHVRPQKRIEGCRHGYWQFGLAVQPSAPFTADRFVQAVRAEGVPAGAHYIGKPIFLCHDAVREQRLFGNSRFPFDHPNARPGITYDEQTCPVTQGVLDRMVTMPMSEFYTEAEIHDMATAVRKVATGLKD
jgi:perosamine synthetase